MVDKEPTVYKLVRSLMEYHKYLSIHFPDKCDSFYIFDDITPDVYSFLAYSDEKDEHEKLESYILRDYIRIKEFKEEDSNTLNLVKNLIKNEDNSNLIIAVELLANLKCKNKIPIKNVRNKRET